MADGLNILTYRKQPDGTYKWDGELVAAAAEYQMQCENGRPFGAYTLARAKEILEKGPLKQDWYKIIPVPEKEVSGAAAAAKARHAERVANGEIKAKTPRVPREKREVQGYQAKPLTAEETLRIEVLVSERNCTPEEAKKLLRTEQRIARLAAARAANPNSTVGKSTLDGDKIVQMFKNGVKVGQIAKELGASYMGVRLRLVKAGLIVKSE